MQPEAERNMSSRLIRCAEKHCYWLYWGQESSIEDVLHSPPKRLNDRNLLRGGTEEIFVFDTTYQDPKIKN
ncbi:hypothetical protein AV530_003672 [Patagioenas fasciata monilis]|uniref:Uncharacterized protein n=1 Tax=Patagioenas fasciata monilis TaxID=372326 RepID=A0A1V4KYJ5_PATFA|nr:hypothetical protein AV530_003672 [Patagioenas fasciata monilis]